MKAQLEEAEAGRRTLVAIGKGHCTARRRRHDISAHQEKHANAGPYCCPPPPLLTDCGAGVGRVSNELLLHLFHEVDLLEPSQPLLQSAQKNLGHLTASAEGIQEGAGAEKSQGGDAGRSRGAGASQPRPGRPEVPAGHRAVNFYLAGLQQHVFETGR